MVRKVIEDLKGKKDAQFLVKYYRLVAVKNFVCFFSPPCSGVVFASISSGFGEITLLSYSAHFDK